ncbi:unnamed protein product [Moneuplotes crassus]|uniref:Uncharacterized protein n=1 Tax=Euplotes crassus TaxID=5936 RepID=A0AAD1XFQ4_EUPCR|nr:unnamed protein product [Moneuplotes crassus]
MDDNLKGSQSVVHNLNFRKKPSKLRKFGHNERYNWKLNLESRLAKSHGRIKTNERLYKSVEKISKDRETSLTSLSECLNDLSESFDKRKNYHLSTLKFAKGTLRLKDHGSSI